jgi:hypothetical protein
MGTNLAEDNWEEVSMRLGQAYRSMKRFMAISSDWTAKVMIEEAFRSLLHDCREFARCQYGIGAKSNHRDH